MLRKLLTVDPRIILLIHLLTLLIALAAIVGAGLAILKAGNEQQNARYDSCLLIKDIVYIATPSNKLTAALHFIRRTPLQNCHTYSHNITVLHLTPLTPHIPKHG